MQPQPPPQIQSPSSTLLTPSLPPRTFIGIDLVTFTSTANFHGIRDLPRGWHFLYSGASETLSLRSGGWFFVGGGHGHELEYGYKGNGSGHAPEIFIWKWDANTETLSPLKARNDVERQEGLRYKANLGAVWLGGGLFRFRSRVGSQSQSQGLVTSRAQGQQQQQQQRAGHDEDEDEDEDEQDGRRDWAGLTSGISATVLSRIVGAPELDADGRPSWMVTSASSAARDVDEIPGLGSTTEDTGIGTESGIDTRTGTQEVEFSFLPIDLKRTWREGAIGRERTEAAQDRSWALGDLVRRYSGPDGDERHGEEQILGELQFTFLVALTLLNFSCLQQWKRLLELVLTSRSVIVARGFFVCDVLRLLLLQLQRCEDLEGGLFALDAADEGGKFLRAWLVRFTRSVDELALLEGEAAGIGSVKSELQRLQGWVGEEFGWDLRPEGMVRKGMVQLEDGEELELEMDGDEDEETGEYAPVVIHE